MPPASSRPSRERLLAAGIYALCGAVAAALLYSAFCQWSWMRMQLNDYGMYTNMLWNSAHGRPFRFLVDQTYLRFHPSFTLLSLAPLFLVWDHPFLLTLVHWLLGVAGSVFVGRLAARHRLSAPVVAAFMLLFLGYPYAQSVLLCEYHGVSLYFVLLPWLYYCLAFRKNLVWLPLLLVLALREDAAFTAIPLLVFFAVADRWKAGYLYALAAVLYFGLATQVLFPLLGDITLDERRSKLLRLGRIVKSFSGPGLYARALAVFWLFLPALPVLRRRGWVPVLTFASLPLLILMGSPAHYHHALRRHYPAAVFTLVVLGMIEALGRRRRRDPAPKTGPGPAFALALVALTLFAHAIHGSLPTGGDTARFYRAPLARGLQALRAAAHVPKDGVLMTTKDLIGFSANRRDILLWRHAKPRLQDVDLLFFAFRDFINYPTMPLEQLLRSGQFGVTYFDNDFVVARRGTDTVLTTEVLRRLDQHPRTITFGSTLRRSGDVRYVPGMGYVTHWDGDGSRGLATLSHGSIVALARGRYTARFVFKTRPPARAVRGTWGLFSLHVLGEQAALAQAEVAPSAADGVRTQELAFVLKRAADVEPRVTAADARLWIDRVVFVEREGRNR